MSSYKWFALLMMLGAASLEVVGDALIRRGLRGGGLILVALGFTVLGSYGVVLTWLRVDFSKLLGTYVGLFALTSILVGWLFFRERIPASTWIGLGVILVGSLIIQIGASNEAVDP
jgi:small multidrug resistance family-3 protein